MYSNDLRADYTRVRFFQNLFEYALFRLNKIRNTLKLSVLYIAFLLPLSGAYAGELLSKMLEGPMKHVEEIIIAERAPGLDGHWYANFGYPLLFPHVSVASPGGGRLVAYNLRTGRERVLLDDIEGAVRDPVLNYEATKILFSYRKGNSRNYHLYEIGVDGKGLEQITSGKEVDDIEPCYLPDGSIMFVSSRCYRWVPCWYTQVGIMYKCDADGSRIRQISFGVEHENTPWMLPDGRVLYTRWEYVDRFTNAFHHLWTVNPDGTGQMVYYGNLSGPHVMIDAKPVPGSDKVAAIFSPWHGRREHQGNLILLDVSYGPTDTRPSPEKGKPHLNPLAEKLVNKHEDSSTRWKWRDPWAFSEDCFLIAGPEGIYVMDGEGNSECVYSAPEGTREWVDGHGYKGTYRVWVHEPRPVIPREREPMPAERVDYGEDSATMLLADINESRNLEGVDKDEISSILVLEELPRPVSPIWSYGDLGYFGIYRRSDVGLTGSLLIHRVLGAVPVEKDGSAYFKVPAKRALFFVALDKDGRSVKRMQSFVSAMPGETASCVGCHESRLLTPRTRLPGKIMAAKRAPSEIKPVPGVPDSGIIDFPRDIQPVITKHCMPCHSAEKHAGNVILTGTRTARTSNAYAQFVMREQTGITGRDYKLNDRGNRSARSLGSAISPLLKKLRGKRHHGVEVSEKEYSLVRAWVESSALFSGTYAKLAHPQPPIAEKGFAPVADIVKERCGKCHINEKRKISMGWPNDDYWDALFNCVEPEKSIFLLAPLSGDAGGWGACREAKARSYDPENFRIDPDAPAAGIFLSTEDPDYKKLEKFLLDELGRHARKLDYFQEGFVPAPFYVREMKRYGVLEEDWHYLKRPLDFFALEEKYYSLFNR